MPNIPAIPDTMIAEHIAWHNRPGNPSNGGRAIDPFPPVGRRPALGSGEEFLVWHEGFVARFRDWVAAEPAGTAPAPDTIRPWTAVPQMLKMSMSGWNADFADQEQLLGDMSNFASLDELGRSLEWSIHGFLHGAASSMWQEPVLLGFESPRSTYFWQLHGLIDHWRQAWVDNSQPRQPEARPQFALLEIGADPVPAEIGAPGEIDRYQFRVTTPGRLTVETTGASDTVLYVAGPDNPQRLYGVNDDGGENFNARVATDFSPGTYFVYVVFYDQSRTGDYALSVA